MSTDESETNEPILLPEQRVGQAMREARETAGISLRGMARRLGYHSHTTLSSYERGAVMPTDEAVEGYERTLGLASGTLTDVLESARIERHGDAWAKRRVHIPAEFVADEPGQRDQPSEPSARGWRRPGRWAVMASGAFILVMVGLAVGLLVAPSGPAPAALAVSGVQDGTDPSVTGCNVHAVTMDSVNVYDPPEHLVGVLQLRSSPRCGTSWARFNPTSALAATPKLTLELDVHRPADGAVAKFRVTYDSLQAYGNMLISSHQCVYAQLTLNRQGQPSLPPVQTACQMAAS